MIIKKYEVPDYGGEIKMPQGAKILSAVARDSGVFIYVLLDYTSGKLKDRYIEVLYTDENLPAFRVGDFAAGRGTTRRFINTVIDGDLVGHVFERTP